MDLLKDIKSAIYKWYPANVFPEDHYYLSEDYIRLRQLIEKKHIDRQLLEELVLNLKARFKSLKIEDMVMGRDFPSYIVQMISYSDSLSVRAIVLYISFIYPCHSCLCLEMKFPSWEVKSVSPNPKELEIIHDVSELTKAHFGSEIIEKDVYDIRLEDILLHSEYKIFNALYAMGYKIV